MAKVLLVEDDAFNRDMLSRRLQRRGYQVVLAVDGPEALVLAEAEKPDLILMDLGLPGMDGYETTRRMRTADATRTIPILALTAHALAGDREKALEAGCDDYDYKPIEFPRLLDKMETLLHRKADS
jgi:CheY-like chemotaxis protein